MAPIWTPDGQGILFSTEKGHLMKKAADGSGAEDSLYHFGSTYTWPFSWSQDGRNLAVASSQRIDLIKVALLGQGDLRIEGEAIEYLSGDYSMGQPQFSPDGRWLAYTSDESGQWEIYVRPLTSSVPRWQASNNGGWKPRWSHDSRELYYRQEDKMMVVKIRLEPEFSATEPSVLFEGDYVHIGAAMDYDVAADGRFLMIHKADIEAGQINVMVNWFDELKRLVPTE